jgi:hypothetical protein
MKPNLLTTLSRNWSLESGFSLESTLRRHSRSLAALQDRFVALQAQAGLISGWRVT